MTEEAGGIGKENDLQDLREIQRKRWLEKKNSQ